MYTLKRKHLLSTNQENIVVIKPGIHKLNYEMRMFYMFVDQNYHIWFI